MKEKMEHAAVIVNPFVIYVGLWILALVLQRLLPLPFLPVSWARATGPILMLISLEIGLPAVGRMLRAKTSPHPHRPTTSLIWSGSYCFTRNPM